MKGFISNKFSRQRRHAVAWDALVGQLYERLIQKINPFNSLRPTDTYKRQYHLIYHFWFPIIGSDNGLSPGRHQAMIWTNARILLTGPLETNFSD